MQLTCTPSCLPMSAKRLAEGRAGGIDGAADREARMRLASAGARDRDQGTAALLQERPGGAGEPHMGEELERKSVLPIGIAEREEVAALGRARIVDQDVQAAEFAPAPSRPAFAAAPGSHRSSATTAALTPLRRTAAATSSSAPASRPVSTRLQPSSASASAMPRPMPRLEPVTRATFPDKPNSISAPYAGEFHLPSEPKRVSPKQPCPGHSAWKTRVNALMSRDRMKR